MISLKQGRNQIAISLILAQSAEIASLKWATILAAIINKMFKTLASAIAVGCASALTVQSNLEETLDFNKVHVEIQPATFYAENLREVNIYIVPDDNQAVIA